MNKPDIMVFSPLGEAQMEYLSRHYHLLRGDLAENLNDFVIKTRMIVVLL